MNFNDINKVADYFRNELMPFLSNRISVLDFSNYLTRISECPSCKWMKTELNAFPINYCVDPFKFLKKYQKKCISVIGSTNPQDGAFHIIYQISPTLHIFARIYHWIDRDEVKAYLMLTVIYKTQEEYLEFYDENTELRLTGNTDERPAGFGAAMNNTNGIENLFKGFNKTPSQENVETNEKQV